MDITKIEENTINLSIAMNSLKYITENFDDRLHEEYNFLLKENKKLFNELNSYNFLLIQLTNYLEKLSDSYYKEVEQYYENNNVSD